MSGILGGRGSKLTNNTGAPLLSSLQIQTSGFGRTLPWVFGQARVAPNLIDYDDFTAHPHTQSQRSGKGGGGNTSASTSYTYTVAALLAIASGPIASIGRIWHNKEQTTLEQLGMDVYPGDQQQTPFPYMLTRHPDKALSYRGIAYLAASSYQLGNSAVLGNHSVEVQATNSIAEHYSGASIPDAEIADVILALLTDPEQGLGLPADTIADLNIFRRYCLANNLWVSPVYTDPTEAHQLIKKLLQKLFV